jgi:hypothetical protein
MRIVTGRAVLLCEMLIVVRGMTICAWRDGVLLGRGMLCMTVDAGQRVGMGRSLGIKALDDIIVAGGTEPSLDPGPKGDGRRLVGGMAGHAVLSSHVVNVRIVATEARQGLAVGRVAE